MVTTDDKGYVKYWQSNMNNVHTFQAHSEPVRCSRWGRCAGTARCNSCVVTMGTCSVYDVIINHNNKNTSISKMESFAQVQDILVKKFVISKLLFSLCVCFFPLLVAK